MLTPDDKDKQIEAAKQRHPSAGYTGEQRYLCGLCYAIAGFTIIASTYSEKYKTWLCSDCYDENHN